MLDIETARLLEMWGRWSKTDVGINIGFKPQTNFARNIGSTVRSETMTDEEACAIDAAVSVLKKIDVKIWLAVKEYYQNGCNASFVARITKSESWRVERLVAEGRGIITGLIYGVRK